MTYKMPLLPFLLFTCFFAVSLSCALAQTFDGNWKVSRTSFECRPTGVISITIKNNKFSGSYMGGTGKHIIAGSINEGGEFKFTGKSPSDTVVFQGKITGDSGKGTWYVAGRNCSGNLKITK